MEYRLLGPVQVEREGRVLSLGGPKQRAVLAILLLRRGTSVPSDVVINELWGESAPPTARNALQGYVFQLRKVLEPDVGRGEPHRVLVSDGSGYRIDLGPDELDIDRFERLTAEGRKIVQTSPAAAAARFEEALALWRGPPLADLTFEPFAQVVTLQLEEEHVAVQELLVEARLGAGGGVELVGELEALVARHPLRERLREHLVLALYRAGRQADALEAFADARSVLVDGLGIEPGDRLRELHRAVLNQDPGLLPAPPEPPLFSRPPPRPPTPLVGRETELRELERLLDDQRLVTLVGPGGVGKTRLALELASGAADRFPGGVLWLPLETARDPQTVTDELAAAVGGEPAARLDGRRVLLVLDNLEQVLGCAPALADIVAATEGPVVLATSRAPLDIAAERRYPVSVLDPRAAAALFRERADALGSPVDDDTVVRHICDRLDGLPLAVELAAARVPAMEPAELLQRLDDRLRVLEGSRRDAPERQRTLRGAIAWSHELLDDDERQGFAALGVFSGGWTQEAAEIVCGTDSVTVASLVEKSLVRRDGARFTMLETVRDFASEQLRVQPGHERVAAAHAAYYCSLVRRLDAERPDGWIRKLESDYANVRAAVDGALTGGEIDMALETLASLHVFWDAHGYSAEGLRRLEAALETAGGSDGVRARGLYAAGILHAHERRFADAERLHRLSAELARAQGDDPALSRALNGVAVALYRQERHDEAESVLREALELKERLRDERGAAIVRGSLGNALRAAGRLAEAETQYEAAVAGLAQVGDRFGEAVALDNLGSTRIVSGDPTGAIPLLRRAVALADELDALSVLASAGAHLGCALLDSDREQAAALLNRSVELFRDLHEPDGVADALDGLAALTLPDDPDRAADLLRSADALRAECGSAPGAVERLLRERIAGRVARGAPVD